MKARRSRLPEGAGAPPRAPGAGALMSTPRPPAAPCRRARAPTPASANARSVSGSAYPVFDRGGGSRAHHNLGRPAIFLAIIGTPINGAPWLNFVSHASRVGIFAILDRDATARLRRDAKQKPS